MTLCAALLIIWNEPTLGFIKMSGWMKFIEHMSHSYQYKSYKCVKIIGGFVYFMDISVDHMRAHLDEDVIIDCLKSMNEA